MILSLFNLHFYFARYMKIKMKWIIEFIKKISDHPETIDTDFKSAMLSYLCNVSNKYFTESIIDQI